jgi:hypothetical protein
MAFTNKNGRSISFECSGLIEELKSDITEFGGNAIIAAWCKECEGVTVYTNYDFIDVNEPVDPEELVEGERIEKMTMTALLLLLEEQNSII